MLLYNKEGSIIGELYDNEVIDIPPKIEMKISENGLDLIKEFESFRSNPYLCPAGKPTIGYGSTRYNDGTKVTLLDKAISKDYATSMLEYQCETIYGDAVNDLTLVMNNQNHFDALTSFTYNVGGEAFRTSTLLRKHNNDDFVGASKEFKKWKYADGKVSNGLVRRRKSEKELYLSWKLN